MEGWVTELEKDETQQKPPSPPGFAGTLHGPRAPSPSTQPSGAARPWFLETCRTLKSTLCC